jgi:predicted nucleotidyltransferase
LHAALRSAATSLGVSLNDYCAKKLSLPMGSLVGNAPARAVIDRAASILGADLVGLVAFGSWARGEASVTSDVDVLIVVGPPRKVTRGLYREWDRKVLTWDGHPVEPHFVNLPDDVHSVGTVWAEAAIDGIVLFERELEVSRTLAAVRRRIAEGRLVRRTIHGQPYWAEVA